MKKILFILFILFCITGTSQTLNDCSTCSTNIIKSEQIMDLSIDEIRYLTNDLFARKGYKFKSALIDYHFSTKEWYHRIDDNAKIEYNETEKQNIKLFQDRTTELKLDREKLLAELKAFKSAFLQKDKELLKSRFNYTIEKDFEDNDYFLHENFKYFSEVLNRLELEQINWFKHQGHYKVIVDNLSETIGYEISIKGNEIYFKYDYDMGSEEVTDDLYLSDYYVEFSHFWSFEWKNGKLKFIKYDMAG